MGIQKFEYWNIRNPNGEFKNGVNNDKVLLNGSDYEPSAKEIMKL